MTIKKTVTPTDQEGEGEDVVLGLRNELQTPTPEEATVAGEQTKKFPPGSIFLIVGGLGLVGGSGFVLFKKMREDNLDVKQDS